VGFSPSLWGHAAAANLPPPLQFTVALEPIGRRRPCGGLAVGFSPFLLSRSAAAVALYNYTVPLEPICRQSAAAAVCHQDVPMCTRLLWGCEVFVVSFVCHALTSSVVSTCHVHFCFIFR